MAKKKKIPAVASFLYRREGYSAYGSGDGDAPIKKITNAGGKTIGRIYKSVFGKLKGPFRP